LGDELGVENRRKQGGADAAHSRLRLELIVGESRCKIARLCVRNAGDFEPLRPLRSRYQRHAQELSHREPPRRGISLELSIGVSDSARIFTPAHSGHGPLPLRIATSKAPAGRMFCAVSRAIESAPERAW